MDSSRPMHAILTSIGSDGDIYPYFGLGAVLRARGHRVTLAASDEYRERAATHGFGFEPLISAAENHALLSNPDFWHPLKGGKVGADWGAPLVGRHFELLDRLSREPDAILIANPGLVAARLVHEARGTPLATLLLQPGMIASCDRPSVLPFGPTLPRWAPRPIGKLFFVGLDAFGYMLVGRHLRSLRKKLGLGPLPRFFRWWLSPQLVVAMFPDWYGQPQADWPPQIRLASFPLYDGVCVPSLDPAVQRFCDEGDPPIAFTFGTGMMHASQAYRAVADACAMLGARGIFLTKYPEQLPSPLPPSLLHVPYAPFTQLFPRCAAVVHHGGVGTAAQAIRAGVPQLAVPHAWDQFDNAVRLKELGVGDWIKPRHRSGKRIAGALGELLRPEVRVRCQALGQPLANEKGLEVAADLIERLFREPSANGAATSARGRAVSPGERSAL